MAITTEIWVRQLAENLFPENSFVQHCTSHDEFVQHHTVHLPQAGAVPSVAINRGSVPASIGKRTDADLTYTLDEFTSDPTLIQDIEETETSYNKMESVLRNHRLQLRDAAATKLLINWAPSTAAQIVRTSGTDSRTADAPDATGNRKRMVLADIRAAARILNKQNVPKEGRVALLPASFEDDLLGIDAFISADKYGSANLPKGSLGMLFGFAIMSRSTVLTYDNEATPAVKGYGATGAAADNEAALLWHPSFVAKAMGEVKVYINENKAEYYGSLFSGKIRMGGRKTYTAGTGVVAIVEAHA